MNMDVLVQNIGTLADKMKDLAKQAVKQYSPEVAAIIKTQDHDVQHIEMCLDYMLDFCFDNEMLTLYKKLCRHYYYINQTAAVSYVNAYREMWDEPPDKEQGD